MGSSWPLVGRTAELDRAAALSREGGVLIAGPPGVGKSRLAAEVMDRSTAERVVRVRATRTSAAMPLGAFAQVLAATGSRVADAEPAERLREAANQLLGDGEDSGMLALWVDDVHALDDTSATLLLHLAMSGRAQLVLTLRSGESVPEPITLLWRDELVGRLDLEPLPQSSVAELLDEVLPGGLDGLASSALSTACRGNLLYLRELVNGLRETGVLAESQGQWFLRGPISAPPRLAELVADRLGSLSEGAAKLLGAVALAEPLGTHELEEQGQWPLAEELLDAGLVEFVVDGRRRQLRALHPLHIEVARQTMGEGTRQELLGGLGRAAEATGLRRRDDARRLAAWRLDEGGAADVAVLVDAAREALFGTDPVMAERFASAALEHEGVEDDVRYSAAHLLGLSLDAQGRFEDAERLLSEIEPDAGAGSDRAMLALARSDNLFRGLGRRQEALDVVLSAEAAIDDENLLDEIRAQRAGIALFSGDVRSTLELIEPLLERADDRAFCQGALMASVALLLSGRNRRAIEISTRAFEARIALGDQVQMADPGIHLVALALAQLEAGELAAGMNTAQAAYDGAVGGWDRHGQGWLSVILARANLLQGRCETAARLARESAVVFGELRHPGCRWGFGALALAAGHLGDAGVAGTAVEDLDAEPPTTIVIMDVDVDRGRAWSLVAAGRDSAGREVLRAAARRARADGQHSLEAAALHDLARLGDAADVVDRMVTLGSMVDGALMAARLIHVDGLASADGPALDAASVSFEQLGADLFAAECATSAAGFHRADGANRAAAASDLRASQLAARCEGSNTPALRGGAVATPLTRREQEVAGLAATGRSNREIADELVVSVRTVENHLQRAYDKLGVRSREGLAEALGT